jgi:hypothetical protein
MILADHPLFFLPYRPALRREVAALCKVGLDEN